MSEVHEQKIIEKLLAVDDYAELDVRVSDTDLMSVVHSNIYVNYFDEGFISFTAKMNKHCGELHKQGIVFPVRKIEIEYLQSATFGDVIVINTRILNVGNKSLTLSMDCYKNKKSDETLLVKGKIVRLIMDLNKNELIKVTDFFNDIV